MDLIHSAETSKDLMFGALPRYAPVWNQSSQTHDLLVKNVTESDLGLYYCAVQEKKIGYGEKGMHYVDVYRYGNRSTRLSLLATPSTPPVSDCSVCWKLLVSVCPACVLLSSISVYCIYRHTAKGSKERREALTGNVFQVEASSVHVDTPSVDAVEMAQERSFPLTWTNQTSADTSASKTLTIITHPAPVSEMERSRVAFITLVYVVVFNLKRVSGAIVEMRVQRGASITLYCDCVWKSGLGIVWFRNCSHEHQPSLIISTMDLIHSAETSKDLMFGAFPRYAPVWNQSSQTHDLLVKNVTELDLGLYYCAVQEKKMTNNEKGMHYWDIYHYGNRSTRLSLLDLTAQDLLPTTPTSPESDCGICWKVLVIVCPLCGLICSVLSSTFVYCIYSKRTKERFKADQRETVKRQRDRGNAQVEGGDVCYATLDIQSTGQRHLKTRRVESSDFSTYSEVRSVPV
ncbi:hypothetical protein AOLI_G00198380 [Acnodon oligacanthus]